MKPTQILFNYAAVVALAMVTLGYSWPAKAQVLPTGGWSFRCDGTTGIYAGPNYSFICSNNHYRCTIEP